MGTRDGGVVGSVGGLGEMFLTEGRKSLWKGEITLFLGK
jgi:hypothetical protein